MGALANAASLAREQVFRDRALAALVYQARNVIANPPSNEAKALAVSLIRNPESYENTAAWSLATDPTIASLGSTAANVPEATLLDRALVAWPYLASSLGPYAGGV